MFKTCYSATATANLSTAWVSSDYYRDDLSGFILFRETNVVQFTCGFYCDRFCGVTYSYSNYIFAIFISATNRGSNREVVWSANRDHPVGMNAILNFTAAGELFLQDVNGSVVWTTNTAGKAVAGMNLTDTGNLVLFDNQNSVVWQSFDHPSDSLLPGQKLFTGQKLKSSVSSSNSSEGMYSLQVMDKGLFAYVESNPPQAYYSWLDLTNKGRRDMRFLNGSLSLFIDSSKPSDTVSVIYISQASSAQYMKLMPDGHLKAFGWQSDFGKWTVVADLLTYINVEECGYPLVCGRNSICSINKQCDCPGIDYFMPVDDRQPELGCSEITPLTCSSTKDQYFITLDNVKYFTVIADMDGVNMETCKQACLHNCSCKAAFFQYSSNASSGKCFLPSEIFTMKTVVPRYFNALAFIKVQNVTSNSQFAIVVGSTIGSFVLLLVVVIGFIMYVVHKRKRDAEMEEEHLDPIPGMPNRFSYKELKTATENFSKKLGEGGFGLVFEGSLKDGSKIAVKCFEGLSHIKKSFMAEKCWEHGTLLDMVDLNSEYLHINSTEVVELMKMASWCLQTDYTRRPSMSSVVKVLQGGMNIESNLDYNFTDTSLQINNIQEKGLTPLLASVLSGPRQHMADQYLSAYRLKDQHMVLKREQPVTVLKHGIHVEEAQLQGHQKVGDVAIEMVCVSWLQFATNARDAIVGAEKEEESGEGSSVLIISVMRISSSFFAFILIPMLSCYSSTAQSYSYSTANLSTTWTTNYSDVQPMLLRETKVAHFACGFICEDNCTSYIFAIFISPTTEFPGPSKVVWLANRGYPVGDSAILNLTAAGELVLRDEDESVAWTTNTAGKSVAGMNLTDTGNLVLFDGQNSVVWQSFDHPTDCLLPGQNLFQDQQLKSSVSLTNSSEGMYFLQVLDKGLVAYVESIPPQAYFSRFFDISGNDTHRGRRYIRFLNGLSFFIHSSEPSDPDVVIYIPEASSAQYMKLMPDGHLQVFQWQSDSVEWRMVTDLTVGFVQICSYPLVCGRNAICSTDEQCICPMNKKHFRPVNDRQPELGCSEITPLTCNSTQDQDFITLENVKYFTSTVGREGVNMETCKKECLNDCSCKAAFFQYHSNTSNGECFLISELFTMKTADPSSHALAFIKVQNVRSPPLSHQVATVVGTTAGSFVLLLVVTIGFIMYLVHKRKRDAEIEEEFLDQVLGMPNRISYEELKIATWNFSKKLGEGGYGSVFEGKLRDGTKIAVKCLEGLAHAKKSFLAEVQSIGSIHHVNLVRLRGFCAWKSQRFLVYDFMSNGSHPEESWHLLIVFQKCWEQGTFFDMVDRHSEYMQTHGSEVVEMMKVASWCLQRNFKRRPSMSSVVKVLEGGMNVEPNLDYNFTDLKVQETAVGEERDFTLLSSSLLSGPR
ncbi:hypothetical protein L1987_61561 [Smallanthus sonchifolius]|uniref:Uncharacterized protein n=1 Tax=Smallanthus sonchifolius TaxID=185202 RepID=A0ACB9C7Z2_9ASTR|nr:hypothetical protein L1987_61561 [Smallanthus sonchifolius]